MLRQTLVDLSAKIKGTGSVLSQYLIVLLALKDRAAQKEVVEYDSD